MIGLAVLGTGCHKDDKDCPEEPVAVVDGRDQFIGQYKVYDTLGNYQYSMEILRSNAPSKDSLFVVNWGSRFNFWVFHDDGDLSGNFGIIPPFPSIDHEGHRWAVFSEDDVPFRSNRMIDDTLRMSYSISNIAFYVDDGVPFFEWSYREYGVKQ